MTRKPTLRIGHIERALRECGGIQSAAAEKLGVTRSAVNHRILESPRLQKAIEETREDLLDFTESKLVEKIQEGHPACIMFYLKTQGRRRGYVERQEQTGVDGQPIQIKPMLAPPRPDTYEEWAQMTGKGKVIPVEAEAVEVVDNRFPNLRKIAEGNGTNGRNGNGRH